MYMYFKLPLVVDSSLPGSLAHIASNAEYYGPSIYLPGTRNERNRVGIFNQFIYLFIYLFIVFPAATEVATTFIFHDPSQLTPLQDNGLPWIILNSLINKKVWEAPVCMYFYYIFRYILMSLCYVESLS